MLLHIAEWLWPGYDCTKRFLFLRDLEVLSKENSIVNGVTGEQKKGPHQLGSSLKAFPKGAATSPPDTSLAERIQRQSKGHPPTIVSMNKR